MTSTLVHYQQGLFCETVNPWWSNLRTPEKLLGWEVSWVAASHQEVFFPFDLHDLSWIDICQLKNMGPTGMFKACDQKMRRSSRAAFFKTPAVLGVDGVGVAGPLTSTSYFCFSPLDFTTVAISPLKTCHWRAQHGRDDSNTSSHEMVYSWPMMH